MQNVKNTMIDRLISGLVPHICCSCGALGALLCSRCTSHINDGWIDRCVRCIARKGSCTHAENWVTYRTDRSQTIKSFFEIFKFQYGRAGASDAARLICTLIPNNSVLVPIPTLQRHIRIRGYDPIELLVRELARDKNLSIARLLVRTSTAVFHTLTRQERIKAAQNLFDVPNVLSPNIRYVLIDDIYTTGSTLRAARAALIKAGARNVRAVVIARQPYTQDSTAGSFSVKIAQSDTER